MAYSKAMPEQIVKIPLPQQHHITCISCQQSVAYAQLEHIAPQLYCTQCRNAYHQLDAKVEVSGLLQQRLAKRMVHIIQSHAPVCECGGLFLFNAQPRCPHCKKHLPLKLPSDVKLRLRFSSLYIQDESKLFLDNGTYRLYQFEHA